MNSVINRARGRPTASPTHCEPTPQPCSTCGQLECLCRPRFFAGQVLTADDLNRLDHYIRGKHRLHNRQLHGWGVVNGLEVICDPCGSGSVTVGCGYALSPCGEDIVVCDAVRVDVCALIKACKEAERQMQPCAPFQHPTPAGCDAGDEEWVLAIRYAEAPTRGVQPLIRPTTVGCSCGPSAKSCTCGGGGAKCSCGNGGGNQCTCGNGMTKTRPRSAPVQCEPTVICEGYAFEVYRKPPDPFPDWNDSTNRGLQLNPDSELFKRFDCCTELLVRRMPKLPGPISAAAIQQNPVVWQQWVCAFKDFLQNYLASKPGYNCELLARVNAIICPPLNTPNLPAVILQTAVLLLFAWLDAVLACLCSALLPPCPTPHPDGRVPLATVRVSSSPCRVLSICNWTVHRKFATTFPALQYWLSILPFGVELRKLLDRICCFQILSVLPRDPDSTGAGGRPRPGAASEPSDNASSGLPTYTERASERLNPKVANPGRLQGAASIAMRALARGKTPLDPQDFIESVLAPPKSDGATLSEVEVANLPQFLLLQQLARPLVNASAPGRSTEGLSMLAALFGGGLADAQGEQYEQRDAEAVKAERDAATEALKSELDALRRKLDEHEEELRQLRAAGSGTRPDGGSRKRRKE